MDNTNSANPAFPIPKIMWVGIAMLALATLFRFATVLPKDSELTNGAGEWTALAMDYAHGMLYRPLMSAIGYGGTRYFPLHPVLQGTFIRAGLKPLAAGYLTTFLCAILLLAGVYRLLRQLDVEPAWAMIGVALALTPRSTQYAITTIRGDLLPAALNIWGLVFASMALSNKKWRWIFVAAILFGLAASAKITTLFGAAAAFSALLLSRKFSRAGAIAGVSAGVSAAVLLAANVYSHGRFFENFRSCASAGGGWESLHAAPFQFVWMITTKDPVGLLILALAGTVFIATCRQSWKELPALALVWTALATALIFLTPGIDFNHLLDVHIIAIVFVIHQLAKRRIEFPTTAAATAVILIVGSLCAVFMMHQVDYLPIRQNYLAAIGNAAADHKLILADDPIGPIFVGQPPFVFDSFMFPALCSKHPEFADDLNQRIRRQEFGVILLQDPADSDEEKQTFGDDFLESLDSAYEKAGQNKTLYFYRPRLAAKAVAGSRDWNIHHPL